MRAGLPDNGTPLSRLPCVSQQSTAEAAGEGITVVTTAELLYGLRTGGIQCPLEYLRPHR